MPPPYNVTSCFWGRQGQSKAVTHPASVRLQSSAERIGKDGDNRKQSQSSLVRTCSEAVRAADPCFPSHTPPTPVHRGFWVEGELGLSHTKQETGFQFATSGFTVKSKVLQQVGGRVKDHGRKMGKMDQCLSTAFMCLTDT